MKFRFVIPIAFCAASLVLAQNAARFPLPRPPADAQITDIGGKNFYSGLVYLEVVADTSVLQSLGFRDFEFQGRSVNSIRYHAFWPQTSAEDSVPGSISGVEYDLTTNPQRVPAPDLGEPDEPDTTSPPASDGSGNE